jgi:hypothetical protein
MLSATQALTVLAEIAPGPFPRALLDHRLAEIAADLDHNRWFRPCELPDTHFMRLVIVDDNQGELPSLLVWESNHDGRTSDYLAAVAQSCRGGTPGSLDALFACCEGYPAGGVGDVEGWVAWMLARARPAGAFYTGYRGVSRREVVNDRRVHEAIREIVDGEDRAILCGLPRPEIQRRIREQVAARHPELDISPVADEEARWFFGKLLATLAAIALLPAILVVALPWYIVLRRKESTDISTAYVRPVPVDPAVTAAEDHVAQNQLTHLVDLKPGRFRLATLWLVLHALDVVARVYSVRGDLGGIAAIHFARWVILLDPRPRQPDRPPRHRLLFFSNYDGSWQSYLGEFIDRASAGLTGVWSNTRGFPPTQCLVLGGARNEEAFKQWTREHQIATQVWWTGCPESTVQNVIDDIWIRRRLDRGLSDDELATWLRKL